MAVGIKGISIALVLVCAGTAHAQSNGFFGSQVGTLFGGGQSGARTFAQTGGQTGSQTSLGASGGPYRAATAEMNRCASQVNAEQKWAPLFVHLPVSAASPSLQQLADQTYPLPTDVSLLEQRQEALTQCRTALIDRLQSVDPRIADLYAHGFAEADQGTLALVQGRLTWGAANEARQQKVLAFRQRIVGAERELPAEPKEASAQQGAGRPQIMSVMAIGLNAVIGLHAGRPAQPTCGAGWSYIPCGRR